MKKLLLGILSIFFTFLNSYAQEIGEIREIELILVDIPFSGDAKQPNFFTLDSTEIISFNDMDWFDKHVNLYDFFYKYSDVCRDTSFHFMVTMIYIPKKVYFHERYEGYKSTGEIANTWILTSIIELEHNP